MASENFVAHSTSSLIHHFETVARQNSERMKPKKPLVLIRQSSLRQDGLNSPTSASKIFETKLMSDGKTKISRIGINSDSDQEESMETFDSIAELSRPQDVTDGTAADQPESKVPITIICIICFDPLVDDEKEEEGVRGMLVTQCGHLFHTNCLTSWFRARDEDEHPCPQCKNSMTVHDTIRIFPSLGHE